MKKYKVTIEEIIILSDKEYPKKETVYEQVFESENTAEIANVIKSVNNITVTY